MWRLNKNNNLDEMVRDQPQRLNGRATKKTPLDRLIEVLQDSKAIWITATSVVLFVIYLLLFYEKKSSDFESEIIHAPSTHLKVVPQNTQGVHIPNQDKLVFESRENQEKAFSDFNVIEEDPDYFMEEVENEPDQAHMQVNRNNEKTSDELHNNEAEIEIVHIDSSSHKGAEAKSDSKTFSEASLAVTPVWGSIKSGHLALQVGSFKNKDTAFQEAQRVKPYIKRLSPSPSLFVEHLPHQDNFPYRVVVGPYKSLEPITHDLRYLKSKRIQAIKINWKK